VIVSIIPFAQTQLRVARPKRASPEGSILSGCMSWYPCVKSHDSRDSSTQPKLAYTWDRYLAIRQVSELKPPKDENKEGPPRLQFQLINEWNGEETIVAMQWLLQQVLVLLTVSQRLLILDTSTMQVTASCDLLMKQVLHFDRFSRHMNNFPAVANAYYHSFKTYKHKLFLLVYLREWV
jgi:vacuolar protein sorting-associated protein 8